VNVSPEERQNEIQFGDLLFTGSSEDRDGVGLTSEVEYSPGSKTYLNSFCFGFRPNDDLFVKGYLKHLFRSREVRIAVIACSNGVTRINISKKSLVKTEIPIPPLEVQREIVSILDKLDALVNDLTFGLPAEITARRKQYEYYRNKLLAFKELETA
jgi:type I restriction enzyme S subunit